VHDQLVFLDTAQDRLFESNDLAIQRRA